MVEDLVHDAVERALRFESTFHPGTNLMAWMRRILFSVFVTRHRRLVRERNALERLGYELSCSARPGEPGTGSGLLPGTESALRSLPPQFASVICLVDLGEQSYQDAAQTLGIPVGTVMSRLHRGRRLLAARIGAGRMARAA